MDDVALHTGAGDLFGRLVPFACLDGVWSVWITFLFLEWKRRHETNVEMGR